MPLYRILNVNSKRKYFPLLHFQKKLSSSTSSSPSFFSLTFPPHPSPVLFIHVVFFTSSSSFSIFFRILLLALYFFAKHRDKKQQHSCNIFIDGTRQYRSKETKSLFKGYIRTTNIISLARI